jgi:hypothetical protein
LEKIVFGRTSPEEAHEKIVMGGIVHVGFMVIPPLIGFGPFCNQINKISFEEIVFDSNHFRTLLLDIMGSLLGQAELDLKVT